MFLEKLPYALSSCLAKLDVYESSQRFGICNNKNTKKKKNNVNVTGFYFFRVRIYIRLMHARTEHKGKTYQNCQT